MNNVGITDSLGANVRSIQYEFKILLIYLRKNLLFLARENSMLASKKLTLTLDFSWQVIIKKTCRFSGTYQWPIYLGMKMLHELKKKVLEQKAVQKPFKQKKVHHTSLVILMNHPREWDDPNN